LRTLTTQNKETISTQKNHVNSELSIVKRSINSVQTKANRADRRIQPLAGKQVAAYNLNQIISSIWLYANQQASTTASYVLPSVSYVINIIFILSKGNQSFVSKILNCDILLVKTT